MMSKKRVEIFKLLGFPIRVDATWLVILLFVTYSLADGFFPLNHPGLPASAYWAMAFVAAMSLFASILFHELAHSLVARHYQIPIDGITLFIFGGIAEMRKDMPSPKVEFLMAVAGPLASGVLAAGCYGLFFLTASYEVNRGLVLIFYYLSVTNALLAAFNLLPAFPLDGGRVFRALLWALRKDRAWATRVAGRVGQGFGGLLIAYGAWQVLQRDLMGGVWAALIGFFLWRASQASVRQVDLKKILQKFTLGPAIQGNFVALRPEDRLFDMASALEEKNLLSHYPVTEAGELRGYLPLSKLQDLSSESWESLQVRDLWETDFQRLVVDAEQNAFDAFEQMQKERSSDLFVLKEGRMVGIVTAQSLMELVQRQAARR